MRGTNEPRITPRQREILDLIASGYSNREAAAALRISENGVKGHVARLLAKYQVPNRAALVRATAAPARDDELMTLLRDTLSELLGETATRALLRRAAAESREQEGTRGLVRALWPLLLTTTSGMAVRRLEGRGIRATGALERAAPQPTTAATA